MEMVLNLNKILSVFWEAKSKNYFKIIKNFNFLKHKYHYCFNIFSLFLPKKSNNKTMLCWPNLLLPEATFIPDTVNRLHNNQ